MNSERAKTLLAFTAIYLVWGSTYYGVSIALKSFQPFLLSALRFFIGGIALAIFCMMRRETLPSTKEIFRFSFWGVVIFGGGVISIVWAQQHLTSSLTAIVITTPFWFIILDRSQWRINFTNAWIIAGLLTGLVGVIILVTQKSTAHFEDLSVGQTTSILVIIAGGFLWVIGSLQLKTVQGNVSVYVRTTIHLLAAGLFALVVAAASDELNDFNVNNVRADSVTAVVLLALISTTMTFIAFVWLIKSWPVAIVSTYAYVNPMVAVLLGVFLGRETINMPQVVAMVVILTGVLLTNIPKYRVGKG